MSKFKDNIPGFPGYHVTKNGDVYSMKCKSGKRPEAFKLKPRLNGNGYYRIGLYKDGIKYLRDLGYSWKDIRIALHLSRVAIEKYKKP